MQHKRFMPLIRELMECAHGFERHSAAHVRELGLTPAQFDIIATLGNTNGMTCRELGEKTLVTKGTLTGILDRLEARGLLSRQPSPDDGRRWINKLTRKGHRQFEAVFPSHMAHLKAVFDGFTDAELALMRSQLQRLHRAFLAESAADDRNRNAQ